MLANHLLGRSRSPRIHTWRWCGYPAAHHEIDDDEGRTLRRYEQLRPVSQKEKIIFRSPLRS
jgi:hypothetical protein